MLLGRSESVWVTSRWAQLEAKPESKRLKGGGPRAKVSARLVLRCFAPGHTVIAVLLACPEQGSCERFGKNVGVKEDKG